MWNLKPDWQAMDELTAQVAGALRSASLAVVDAHISIREGAAEGWITLRAGDEPMHLRIAPETVYRDDDSVPHHIGWGGYSLPQVQGKVANELSRVHSRFWNLLWSNPTSSISPSAFERLNKAQQRQYLQEEAAAHRAMLEQAVAERRAAALDVDRKALDEAWEIMLAVLAEQDADLAAGVIR
jgi:hypothetical protein